MVSGRRAKRDRQIALQTLDAHEALADAMSNLRERSLGFGGDLKALSAEVAGHPRLLLPVLNSRALKRAADHAEHGVLLPPFAWRSGYAISAADQMLERMGAPWYRADVGTTNDERWLAELRDGLDTYARICWCLRFGYTFAAVAVARRYIERWTYNLAYSTDMIREEGEKDEDYLDRIWLQYAPIIGDRSIGSEWSVLSELLHGRSADLGSTAVTLDLQTSTTNRARVHNFVIRAAELPLRQVRGGIGVAAADRGITEGVRAASHLPVKMLPHAPDPPDFLNVFFRPPDHDFATSDLAATTSAWGRTYRRTIKLRVDAPIDVKGFDSWMAIEERWVRTLDEARNAFELEARDHADISNPDILAGALIQYRSIAEMADLVAGAIPNEHQGRSLRTAAMALESAWILWLQDVDDSLSCMRTALESTARARVHRLKPKKAETLELRGRLTTPHRWVEAAGWGRLAPFVRALGEFVHVQERSRHSGSRALLTNVQREPVDGSEEQTARARALAEVAAMLGYETAATLENLYPQLAEEFRLKILLETVEESERKLADWLDRVLQFRSHNFGAADYSRLDETNV